MDITWLGHACFRLKGASATILTDPFPDSLGGSVAGVESAPNIVTVSNTHPNHSSLTGLDDGFRPVEGPGEYGVSGVYIRGFMTPPSPEPVEQPPPRNTAYLFECEGLRLCHLGNLAAPLSNRMMDELSPLDVLLLPVGGSPTLELDHRVALVRQLEARIVIPMLYKVPGSQAELAGLDPFMREMGLRDVEEQPRISVTTTNLPAETRVVPLRPTAIPAP